MPPQAVDGGERAVPETMEAGTETWDDAGPSPSDGAAPSPSDGAAPSPSDGAAPESPLDAAAGLDAGDVADAGSGAEPSSDGAATPSLDRLRTQAYPPPSYPTENPFTEEKALLGKILFWEEQMSGDDTVACGTCHRGAAGGSDPRSAGAVAHLPGADMQLDTDDDVRGSPGIVACDNAGETVGQSVQVTGRKAPSYLDAMFSRRLFWDGRAECTHAECPNIDAFEDPDNPGTFPIAIFGALENQAVGPPLSTVEMTCEGTTWSDIHTKLAGVTPLALASEIPGEMLGFITDNGASYPELFAAAFGSEQTSGPETEINTRRIAFAIATHERRLQSNQTPWDVFNAGDDAALTDAQVRGLVVFRERAQCSSCHLPPLFSDGAFHFTGFHRPTLDPGREAITGRETDRGQMKTPTLRNLSLRVDGGLLHNGSGLGSSLGSVVETYVGGGLRDDPDVAGVPITASIEPLDLSEQEIDDLLEFLLGALTDPRVAAELPPFDRPRLSTE